MILLIWGTGTSTWVYLLSTYACAYLNSSMYTVACRSRLHAPTHTHPYTRTPTHGAKRYRRREARMVLLFRIILRLIMKIGQILKILTQTTLSSVLPSESPDERTFCPEPRNPETPKLYSLSLGGSVCVSA